MAFLGIRGTGDWATDERPKNWRQGILYLYPNGMAPLTGLLSKMADEKVDDPQFHWWTKTLAQQRADVTGVYTNTSLVTAYTSGGVAGDTVFVKMSAAQVGEFRIGHQVLLRDSTDITVDVNAKVTAVVNNGVNSYIAAKLLENDNNSLTHDLSDCDTALIIGNINPEAGPMPDAVAYNPVKYFNYTQIQRTSLAISRTARRTHLRTEDAYKEAKRESLELHSIEIEKTFFWGIASENVGVNGKPERTTQGLIPFIKENVPANVSDFSLDANHTGESWLQGGEEWLDSMLEQIFRYGSMEKMAFAGSGALLGINRLAKSSGQIFLKSMDAAYGLKVVEWITPFGVLYVKTHPLFSFDVTTRNAMVILEPRELRYRYVDDTHFVDDDGKHGPQRLDGTFEEWVTECGLEMHFPPKFGYLTGLNTDNSL